MFLSFLPDTVRLKQYMDNSVDKENIPSRFLLMLLLMFVACASQAEDKGAGYWSIQLENDVFAKSGDRYYTHGTQVSYLTRVEPDYWLTGVARLVPFYHISEQTNAVTHTVGQKIFTPDDTDSTEIIADDRPYAGYLYYNTTLLSRIDRNEYLESGNMLGLTIGIVGPSSRAEDTQKWYHDTIGIDSPNGWDNQLHDELALGISYTRLWSIVIPATPHFEFGVAPHFTMSLGNVYTYGAGGVMFRFGTHLKGDLSPPNISPGFPGASFFDTSQKYNWYFFAGHESRVIARNIFLDGNSYGSSPTVTKERLIGDHQFGFAVHTNKVRIALSQMIRTKEYTTQEDQMQYGAINISFFLD